MYRNISAASVCFRFHFGCVLTTHWLLLSLWVCDGVKARAVLTQNVTTNSSHVSFNIEYPVFLYFF